MSTKPYKAIVEIEFYADDTQLTQELVRLTTAISYAFTITEARVDLSSLQELEEDDE